MTIVVYHEQTHKIVAMIPINVIANRDTEVEIEELDDIIEPGYDYIIHNGTEPIINDKDGVLYLDTNRVLLWRDYLG